jgi:hypothetical protein
MFIINMIVSLDVSNNPLVNLQLVDFPGGYNFPKEDNITPEEMLRACGALIFVIDATVSAFR